MRSKDKGRAMKRYAIWCSEQNVNLFKDGRSFVSLAYAENKCSDVGWHMDTNTLYIKEIEVPTIKELEAQLKEKDELIKNLCKGLHAVTLEHYRSDKKTEPDWSEIEHWQDYLEKLEEQKES